MTKYAAIPEFGQFVEYITQAPAIDGFCDVIINQVDLLQAEIKLLMANGFMKLINY